GRCRQAFIQGLLMGVLQHLPGQLPAEQLAPCISLDKVNCDSGKALAETECKEQEKFLEMVGSKFNISCRDSQ
ncbi:hypothetical protein ACIQRH_08570, partial [Pseudomonas sp. NPDC090964]|uniref:hypothetical protein n=1 Tax=Pseudomonas sp. NPDC090964 TaxID=3364482 RepID=UPI00381F4E4D